MTDLEDLEEIVEQNHFGMRSLAVFTGARPLPTSRKRDTCGRGHDLMVTGRWRSNGANKPRRRICIECSRLHTGYKGTYRK